MFYFVSAWYPDGRPWSAVTEPFYRWQRFDQFDDTVHQLRMFGLAEQDSQLVVLNYAPHLRYGLHRYDLLEVPVWSLFDQIQDIKPAQQVLLDARSFDWPAGTTFIYTPFLMLARLGQETLAQVEYGADGQLIWLLAFEDNQPSRRYLFDDRGFLSSVVYFDQGQEHYQDYLNQAGDFQIREYLLPHDQHVMVAESQRHRFKRKRYESMAELVREQVEAHFDELLMAEDRLVVAADHQHNQLLLNLPGQHQTILSYHQGRVNMDETEQLLGDVQLADLVVVDRLSSFNRLRELGVEHLEHLSPFDTRLRLGWSQRLKALKVYFLVDGLSDQELEDNLLAVFDFMAENDQVELLLVTYDHEEWRRNSRLHFLEEVLSQQDAPYLYLEKEDEPRYFEVIEDGDDLRSRVSHLYLNSELSIQEELVYARVIVDLQKEPDLYTQIAGISAGIPQINRTENEFVDHLKNGYLLKDEESLMVALVYYLTGLANWNRSLVYAVKKIDDYTSGRLVDRLLGRLEAYE